MFDDAVINQFLPIIENVNSHIILRIRLTPKAANDRIGKIIMNNLKEPELKVYVTAIPEKGKANKALIELLAKTFKSAKSDWEIMSGFTDPHKILSFKGNPQYLKDKLRYYI